MLYVAAAIVLVTLGAILIILFVSGQHAFERFGVQFLWTDQWDPVRDLYGAAAPIAGKPCAYLGCFQVLAKPCQCAGAVRSRGPQKVQYSRGLPSLFFYGQREYLAEP